VSCLRCTRVFHDTTGGDEVFRQLVLARIIEPTSKEDSVRVLEEVGVNATSYPTIKRRLPDYADDEWRRRLAAACAARAALGPTSLVLYDVTTLYFETDKADGFREPGFSKERRLEPQITLGLLTDATGAPLIVEAFEGNKAETKTMLPVIEAFKSAHDLAEVTVVADAGMISEANREGINACRYGHMMAPMARAATTSDVFNAIAEPQRREILVLLRAGERPVTELAQELGMTQPGASKHLRVLREVGLVRDRKAGKQRLYGLDARGLRPVHEWTGGFERFWNESFDRLDAYVQDLKQARQEE
jgi:DNA-binding transcriptional ArsR family regulator